LSIFNKRQLIFRTNKINIIFILLAFLFVNQSQAGQRTLSRKTLLRPPIDEVSKPSIWDQNFRISLLKNNNLILQSYAIQSLSSYPSHQQLVKQHLSRILLDSNLDARSLILLAEVCNKNEFAEICKLAEFNDKRALIDPNNLFSYLDTLVQQINESDSISHELQQNILNSTQASYYFAKGLNDFYQAMTRYIQRYPVPEKDSIQVSDDLSESDLYFYEMYKQNHSVNFISGSTWARSIEDKISSDLILILIDLKLDDIQLHIFNLLSQSDSYSSQLVGLALLKRFYKKTKNFESFKQASIQRAKISSTLNCQNQIEETVSSYKDYKRNTPIYYQAYNEIVEQQGKLNAQTFATNTLKNYISNIQQNETIEIVDCIDKTKLSDSQFLSHYNQKQMNQMILDEFHNE
jgi:hypothetical protein